MNYMSPADRPWRPFERFDLAAMEEMDSLSYWLFSRITFWMAEQHLKPSDPFRIGYDELAAFAAKQSGVSASKTLFQFAVLERLCWVCRQHDGRFRIQIRMQAG